MDDLDEAVTGRGRPLGVEARIDALESWRLRWLRGDEDLSAAIAALVEERDPYSAWNSLSAVRNHIADRERQARLTGCEAAAAMYRAAYNAFGDGFHFSPVVDAYERSVCAPGRLNR